MPIIHSPTTPQEHIHSLLDNPVFDEIEQAENENPFGKNSQTISSTNELISLLQPYLSHFFPENNFDLSKTIKSLPKAIKGNLFSCTKYLLDFDINQLDFTDTVFKFADGNTPDLEYFSDNSFDPIISITNFDEYFDDFKKESGSDFSPDQALALRSLSYYLDVIVNLKNPDQFNGKDINTLHLADRCLFEAGYFRIRNSLGKRLQKPSESKKMSAKAKARYKESDRIKHEYLHYRKANRVRWKSESKTIDKYIEQLSEKDRSALGSREENELYNLKRIIQRFIKKELKKSGK